MIEPPRERWRLLMLLAACVLLALTPWFSAAAVAPSIAREWGIDSFQTALLTVYELPLAALAVAPPLPRPKHDSAPAKPAELDAYFDDAARTLELIEFYKKRDPEAIMRTVRAIARRADLTAREAKLLRAMAIEVRKYIERRDSEM